jgi:hypothetical protein
VNLLAIYLFECLITFSQDIRLGSALLPGQSWMTVQRALALGHGSSSSPFFYSSYPQKEDC